MNVTELLISKNKTITFMESCTSGLLASTLTDTEGASAIFKGSDVTYANKEKIRCGVPQEVIETYGVYSAECARAMAKACKERHGADISVGITGTTGNQDPNNPGSVQGTAWYCICLEDQYHDFSITADVAGLSRAAIKQLYAERVYQSLLELLTNRYC